MGFFNLGPKKSSAGGSAPHKPFGGSPWGKPKTSSARPAARTSVWGSKPKTSSVPVHKKVSSSPFGLKPRVTSHEFKKVRGSLWGKGVSSKDIKKVEGVFRGDLHEHRTRRGIDEKELGQGIDWMKKNKSAYGLSDKKIDAIEEEMKKHL